MIHAFIHIFIHSFIHVQSVENVGTRKKRNEHMRKATDVETHSSIHPFIHSSIHPCHYHPFIRSFISFVSNRSFIHVQSVENVGTRKKRKENMRKAFDVETEKRKTLKNV